VTARRAVQAVAVLLGLLVLVLAGSAVWLDSLVHAQGTGGPVVESLSVAAAAIPATAVSTLLAVRRPANPIGWLLFGILIVLIAPTSEYNILAYRLHPGSIPLGWVSVVIAQCWPLFLALVAVLLWVFPDGKLPAGRARRPAVTLLVLGSAIAVATSTSGMVVVARGNVRVDAAGNALGLPGGGYIVLEIATMALSLGAWLAWIVIQFPTYRRADGERRQQLKWLYSGAAITLIGFALGVFVAPLALGDQFGNDNSPVVQALIILACGALPLSLGVAVLKYRLYELDRIISRVVSYTVITVLLAAVFAGLVLLTTRVLPFQGSVAVAASTLVTAALFNPLRRRVQHAVDRRFNRARYNAEAVVAAFTARLRNNIDLDAVRADMIGVVDEAVQPTRISMWLAPMGPDN
jgi:hypothetical protein